MNRIKQTLLYGGVAALMCSPGAIGAPPTTSTPQMPPAQTDTKDWSDQFTRELGEIQDRMENLFNRAWKQGREAVSDFRSNNGFGASLNLSEEKDHYTVRLTLPDRDIQKVDVRVDPDNTLHVIANEEKRTSQPDVKGTEKDESLTAYSLSRYEQKIGLPGPVDSAKMTVDRKGNTLTVTIPKAEASPTTPKPES